LAILSTLAIT